MTLTRSPLKRKASLGQRGPILKSTSNFRQRKCTVCTETFRPQRMGQRVCSPSCAAVQGAKDRQKQERKETRERKQALKTRSDWLKEAQIVFNQFVRLRDQLAGHACISSGRPLDWSGNAVDAGHFRSVGSAPHLRFNEDNCHAQSKHDNQYKSGNAIDYRIGLIARIGLARVEALEADQTPRHYTIEDLKRIKAEYRAKLRALKETAL
jgi:hypothetical protein